MTTTTTIPDEFKVGAALPAVHGVTILQARRVRGDEFVLLCLWNEEFVTWVGRPSTSRTDPAEVCWGHYHGRNLPDALDDYQRR